MANKASKYKKHIRFGLMLADREKEGLSRMAEDDDCSESELIRRLIKAEIKRREADKELK